MAGLSLQVRQRLDDGQQLLEPDGEPSLAGTHLTVVGPIEHPDGRQVVAVELAQKEPISKWSSALLQPLFNRGLAPVTA